MKKSKLLCLLLVVCGLWSSGGTDGIIVFKKIHEKKTKRNL